MTFDFAPARLVHNVFAPAEPLPPRAANGTLTHRVSFAAGEGESLIRVAWPYVLLGGELVITGGTARDVGIGAEDEGWTMLPTRSDGTARKLDLTPWFIARKDALRRWLRVRGASGEAKLTLLFQFARAPCRAVRPGTTTFDITLSPAAGAFPADWKGLEVTHEWDEPRRAAR